MPRSRPRRTLIGIRGGVTTTDGKGGIYSGYGTMTVTSGGRLRCVGAAEFTQTQAGAPPTPPLPPPGFVQQQIAIFQSAAGQTGGVRAGTASAKNIATAAQRATGSPNGLVTGSGAPPTPAPPPIVEQLSAISSAFTQSIQISNQAEAVQQIAQDRLTGIHRRDFHQEAVHTSTGPAHYSPPDNHNPLPTDNNTPPPNARPSVTLSGYVGGLDVITGNQIPVRPVSGTSEITLDAANNRVQGNLDIHAYDSMSPFTQLAGTVYACSSSDRRDRAVRPTALMWTTTISTRTRPPTPSSTAYRLTA